MNFVTEWKDGGSQRFWAKAYLTSVYLQSVLAIAFPIVAVTSLILYFVFAHGFNIWYTASFWILLACAWALPPCFFVLYLFMLKIRSNKATLYDLDDDDRADDLRDSLIAREERRGEGLVIEEDDEEEGDEDRPPKKKKKKISKPVKRSFSLDFIADGYVEHRFVPTVWNGLGITACVFGLLASLLAIVCNFGVGDVPAGVASVVTFLTVGSCMYLIIHRSLGVRESVAMQEMAQEEVRHVRTFQCLVIAWKLVFVLLGFIAVIITILAALQSFVYAFNLQHYTPPGKMYNIGGRREMHMDCNGTGGPTVVFLHGWGGQAYDWALVRPSISLYSKSCAIDRTGYGWTSAPDCLRCPRTAKVQAADLNALFLSSQIANDSLLFVAHAEAVLDLRVFFNTYKNYRICGVVCVDCVDTGKLNQVGAHLTNPVSPYWDMWRNLLPTGLLGVMAATGKLQKFDMINLLPNDIHPNYIQNELKPKYPETVVLDQVYLPQAAQEAVDAGGFGSLHMVALIAGRGLNATGVSALSTNSSLIPIPKAPHNMPFHQNFANIIIEYVRQAVSFSQFSKCSVSPFSSSPPPSSPPSSPPSPPSPPLS